MVNLSKLTLFLFVVTLGFGAGFVIAGGSNGELPETGTSLVLGGSEEELRESCMPVVLKCSINKDGKICKVHDILPLDVDLVKGLKGALAAHDEHGQTRSVTMQGVCLMKDGSKKLLHGIFILGHQGVVWFIPHGIRIFSNVYNLTSSVAQRCFTYLGNQIPATLSFDFDLKNIFGNSETDEDLAMRLQMEEFAAAEELEKHENDNSK